MQWRITYSKVYFKSIKKKKQLLICYYILIEMEYPAIGHQVTMQVAIQPELLIFN